ncbi:MAG TPA: hypothetical protein VGR56_03590 [Nitrososphaerales archaeon]|nr:hypothetical protein [Nitrososphaerales archaeon]
MRPRTLALFSCLIMFTIALGALSLGFSTSLRGVLPSKPNVNPSTTQQQGNLLVKALYEGGAPVMNASVSIRDIASRLLFPLPYHTNASGELSLTQSPGLYKVAVSNDEFQTSATLRVSSGNTTLMDVSVNKTIRATVFNELRTTGHSAFAPPWEQVEVAIVANVVLYHPGDTVFIQRYLPQGSGNVIFLQGLGGSVRIVYQNGTGILFYYGNYGNLTNNPEIKANVVYSDLRVENQTSLLWLTLNVDKFLSLDLWPGLQLVTYTASNQVSTFGG